MAAQKNRSRAKKPADPALLPTTLKEGTILLLHNSPSQSPELELLGESAEKLGEVANLLGIKTRGELLSFGIMIRGLTGLNYETVDYINQGPAIRFVRK